ncbi:MAG: toprim domain-containing protein [Bacterioplanes sp.]|nr:toprim domain-containing protein [Bacterioplanes sp.]
MSSAREYQALVRALDQLPGIGPQAALRCARWLLQQPQNSLLEALQAAQRLQQCPRCRRYWQPQPQVEFCCNSDLGHADLLVVVYDDDVEAYRQQGYRGRFFILHGLLSPMQGIGPKQLRLSELVTVLQREPVARIGLCLPSDVEAQTTAYYIRQLIQRAELPIQPDVMDVDTTAGELPWPI